MSFGHVFSSNKSSAAADSARFPGSSCATDPVAVRTAHNNIIVFVSDVFGPSLVRHRISAFWWPVIKHFLHAELATIMWRGKRPYAVPSHENRIFLDFFRSPCGRTRSLYGMMSNNLCTRRFAVENRFVSRSRNILGGVKNTKHAAFYVRRKSIIT